MMITTPARQVPLGVSMSVQRRHDVIRWARDTNSWIVEDDYESEFCARCRNISTIFDLDRYSRTIFFGKFSNVLHPNIRISYIILPDRLPQKILNAADILLDGIYSVQQKVLAEFITSGALARHLNKSRRVYNERRGMMIAALKECFGSRIDIREASGGLQLVCAIESSARDIDICASGAPRIGAIEPVREIHRRTACRRNFGRIREFYDILPDEAEVEPAEVPDTSLTRTRLRSVIRPLVGRCSGGAPPSAMGPP